MSRSRFVWHLFASLCAALAAGLFGTYWLASVGLARLAEAAADRRVGDAAAGLAAVVTAGGEGAASPAFLAAASGLSATLRARVDLLAPDGGLLTTSSARGAVSESTPANDALLSAARSGRVAKSSRYEAAAGRRIVVVAVPAGSTAQPTAVVRVTADTTVSDADLAHWQRWLLVGFLGWGAALAVGSLAVARRLARPVSALSTAAARLAGGDVHSPLPAAESMELAVLGEALATLREQLVERGLTIGRQGTQQEAVLGSMIEGVLAIDARQRVVGINQAAVELLGVDADRAIGRQLQEVVRNPDLRRFALRAIDCREPVEDDLLLRGLRDRTLRMRGTALRDVSGDGGAVIVLNDVTEMMRLERVRRDFVANVSHELKTPIASIKGFVETLLDGATDDPADRRRFLDIIARQADRLASIIDDLLALSRIEQSEGTGDLPRQAVRLRDLLAAVVGDCQPRAADRSIRLEVECAEALAAEVNPPLVEQAVINLVDNAIKYSEPGRSVRIVARAGSATDHAPSGVLVSVRDQGCGIDAEHLPRLFERFYRVDKARSRKLGGTGLGLSIVKHIVQAHGGTVAVESEPGVGSTFTIRLP